MKTTQYKGTKRYSKGDFSRYMMWVIILIVMVVLILALYYAAGLEMMKDFILFKIFGIDL